jgi:hypothetical protein
MKKGREITIKVTENKDININKLAKYFAQKYSEKNINQKS